MNRRTLATVIAILFMFALSGTAAKKPTTLNVTLDTTCTSCANGVAIGYSGSGYPAYTPVYIDVQGPIQFAITTSSDGAGNFFGYYGSTITYSPGDYTATATIMNHKTAVVVATTQFTVQP